MPCSRSVYGYIHPQGIKGILSAKKCAVEGIEVYFGPGTVGKTSALSAFTGKYHGDLASIRAKIRTQADTCTTFNAHIVTEYILHEFMRAIYHGDTLSEIL